VVLLRLGQGAGDLSLQSIALIKKMAHILRHRSHSLLELVFVDAWQFVEQTLILVKLSLGFGQLALKVFEGLRSNWPRRIIFIPNHLMVYSI
jgi:hypothetical protein